MIWRHIAYNYRSGGAVQVIRKVIWRTRKWVHSEETCMVHRASTASPVPHLGMEHQKLEMADLLRLGYFKAVEFPDTILRRLQTAICHGFFVEGQLVNIAWTEQG